MDNTRKEKEDSAPLTEETGNEVSESRRKAVAKLAYASPVIAGVLFSRGAAAFTPPPRPGG